MPLKEIITEPPPLGQDGLRRISHSPTSHRRALSVESSKNQKPRFAFALAMRNDTESRPTQHTAVVALSSGHKAPTARDLIAYSVNLSNHSLSFFNSCSMIQSATRSALRTRTWHRALQSGHSPWLYHPPLAAAHWTLSRSGDPRSPPAF